MRRIVLGKVGRRAVLMYLMSYPKLSYRFPAISAGRGFVIPSHVQNLDLASLLLWKRSSQNEDISWKTLHRSAHAEVQFYEASFVGRGSVQDT